jgi:hypothetical protein
MNILKLHQQYKYIHLIYKAMFSKTEFNAGKLLIYSVP